jgi:hypothetical protein
MCGLWGVFNKSDYGWLGQADMEVARDMSIGSAMRGSDSSGMCIVPRKSQNISYPEEPWTFKGVGSPFTLWHSGENIRKFIQWGRDNGRCIFGHSRNATSGTISNANAHPFIEGDWVLVHNGTLTGGFVLKDGVEVDSHALCVKMNECGIETALKEIQGAYAIIAYNKATCQVFVARNHMRDLHWFEYAGVIHVMSEDYELRSVLNRNSRYKKTHGKPEFPVQFEPEILYVLTENGFEKTTELKKELPPVLTNHREIRQEARWNRSSYERPENMVVVFEVKEMVSKGPETFQYLCDTVDTHEVVRFISRAKMPELVGKVGCGVVMGKMKDTGNEKSSYFVKFREIDWEAGEAIHTCQECGDAVEMNGKQIELMNQKYICGDCVEEWRTNGYTVTGVAN